MDLSFFFICLGSITIGISDFLTTDTKPILYSVFVPLLAFFVLLIIAYLLGLSLRKLILIEFMYVLFLVGGCLYLSIAHHNVSRALYLADNEILNVSVDQASLYPSAVSFQFIDGEYVYHALWSSEEALITTETSSSTWYYIIPLVHNASAWPNVTIHCFATKQSTTDPTRFVAKTEFPQPLQFNGTTTTITVTRILEIYQAMEQTFVQNFTSPIDPQVVYIQSENIPQEVAQGKGITAGSYVLAVSFLVIILIVQIVRYRKEPYGFLRNPPSGTVPDSAVPERDPSKLTELEPTNHYI